MEKAIICLPLKHVLPLKPFFAAFCITKRVQTVLSAEVTLDWDHSWFF